MRFNTLAPGIEPFDMTTTAEFESLLQSAADLGLEHSPSVRYVSRNVVARQHRFNLLEWGAPSAPPLLFLHGGHQSAHSWDLVSLALADRFHIYALDQRGHGDSEWAVDLDYSTDAMAADAEALIEAEGIRDPIIFGHSMGGFVTMTLLKRWLVGVRAALLVDVGPEISQEGAAMIGDFVQQSVEFDDLEDFVAKVRAYDPFRTREHIERTVKYNMVQRADGKFISKCDSRRSFGVRSITRSIQLDDVRDFDLPVLVVRGEASNVLLTDAAERFAAALPQGRLVTVPRSGHNVHSQNTPGFLEAAEAFLRELGS